MASSARIDELKKKFDENPRRYFAPLANEFRKAGDAEQAIMICEEFLPQQPGHMSGHIVYGQALFDLGRLEEARAVFETALTLDPENLIALRHLGDIARSHGDLDLARRWYQRVLEADPRNEEIQQVIASLGESESSPVAAGEPAAGERVVAASSFAPPPLAPPVSTVSEAVLEQDFLELDVVEEHALPPATPDVHASPPDVPLDSVSLEGLEPTASTDRPAAAGDRAAGLEPMEFTAPTGAMELPGFDDQLESGEFTAPSAPIAPLAGLEESAVGSFERRPERESPPALPDQEPMAEDENGAPVDIPPAVIAAEAELLDARGESESAAPSDEEDAATPDTSAVRAASLADTGTHHTPSQPFVTETMAELYVKQGFREQALDVYKLLLAASPDSARLRERVAALQPVTAPDAGPNVREFFARIAAHRPGQQAAAAAPPSDDDFASFETIPAPDSGGSAASAAAPRPEPTTEPVTMPAPDGSINALFGHRPVGASEDSAASALAQAFGGGNEPPPITGRPARAAAGELSLDSVFRDGGARPPRGSQSFSFDQFFSESAATERAAEPPPGQTPSQGIGAQGGSEPAERSADDIEQFNSWLQGLKQR
jgi:tetratricopeptide (TPR) repeat protein